MMREFYEKKIEALKKKKFKRLTDGLFEVAYFFGMYGTEGYKDADPIRLDFALLAARYACAIEKEIRKGEKAQEKLRNLSEDQEES